jgi:hypothetical protein
MLNFYIPKKILKKINLWQEETRMIGKCWISDMEEDIMRMSIQG